MTKEQIDDIVSNILKLCGHAGQIDGHEYITEFISDLLEGKGEAWLSRFSSPKNPFEPDGEAYLSES